MPVTICIIYNENNTDLHLVEVETWPVERGGGGGAHHRRCSGADSHHITRLPLYQLVIVVAVVVVVEADITSERHAALPRYCAGAITITTDSEVPAMTTTMMTLIITLMTLKQVVQLGVDVDAVAQQVAHLVVGSGRRRRRPSSGGRRRRTGAGPLVDAEARPGVVQG